MLQSITLLLALAYLSYRDWKEQKICLYTILLLGIAGLLLHMVAQNRTVWDILGGAAVGAVLLAAAWIGRGTIGSGDGLVLMATGLFLGFVENIRLLVTALLLAGAVALFCLLTRRKGRKDQMPFIPFLLAAYLIELI